MTNGAEKLPLDEDGLDPIEALICECERGRGHC
jgi:hypothetical protein